MERTVEVEAKSQEEAIELAAERLGAAPNQIEIEEVEETKGLLGLGRTRTIKIRARIRDDKPQLEELARVALERVVPHVSVTAEEHEEAFWLNVKTDEPALVIGRHGQTLEALQFLLGIIARRQGILSKRLILDVDGYREKRREDIESLAKRVIDKVMVRGEPIALHPMTAFERKVVHTVAGEHPDVRSSSSGDEPERFVTISPASDQA